MTAACQATLAYDNVLFHIMNMLDHDALLTSSACCAIWNAQSQKAWKRLCLLNWPETSGLAAGTWNFKALYWRLARPQRDAAPIDSRDLTFIVKLEHTKQAPQLSFTEVKLRSTEANSPPELSGRVQFIKVGSRGVHTAQLLLQNCAHKEIVIKIAVPTFPFLQPPLVCCNQATANTEMCIVESGIGLYEYNTRIPARQKMALDLHCNFLSYFVTRRTSAASPEIPMKMELTSSFVSELAPFVSELFQFKIEFPAEKITRNTLISNCFSGGSQGSGSANVDLRNYSVPVQYAFQFLCSIPTTAFDTSTTENWHQRFLQSIWDGQGDLRLSITALRKSDQKVCHLMRNQGVTECRKGSGSLTFEGEYVKDFFYQCHLHSVWQDPSAGKLPSTFLTLEMHEHEQANSGGFPFDHDSEMRMLATAPWN